MGKNSIKLIANNKKAYFDYFIDDKFECGISLAGTEVKSLRMGKCSVKESFVRIVNDEVMIYGMHISPYEKGNIFNKDPLRERKLLMHRYEINKLKGKIQEKGYTLVPLQVYFKGSLVKVEIGLARGKKLYDKRADIAKKDQRRELEKDFKEGSPWMAAIPILPLISSPFMPQWNVWSGGWILSGRASRWQTGPVQKRPSAWQCLRP